MSKLKTKTALVTGASEGIGSGIALELASRGIRVNSVNPGATLSEGTKEARLDGVGSYIEKRLVSMTPLGLIESPLDISRKVF